jgi:hypothetical protein
LGILWDTRIPASILRGCFAPKSSRISGCAGAISTFFNLSFNIILFDCNGVDPDFLSYFEKQLKNTQKKSKIEETYCVSQKPWTNQFFFAFFMCMGYAKPKCGFRTSTHKSGVSYPCMYSPLTEIMEHLYGGGGFCQGTVHLTA